MANAEGILRLLIVDSSLTDADIVTGVLRGEGYSVRASRVDIIADVEAALSNQSWDLVFCRDTTLAVAPCDVVNLLERLGKDIPCFVLVSEQDNINDFFDLDVHDVIKFYDISRLKFSVSRELKSLEVRRSLRQNERILQESEKRSRLLLESARDAVCYMHEGMHIYVNDAYLSIFGYADADDIDGLPILDMILSDDHAKFKTVYREFTEQGDQAQQTVVVQCVCADSSNFMASLEFSHVDVEGEGCTQVIVREEGGASLSDELTEAVRSSREYDFLTGLYSRSKFRDKLEAVAAKASEGTRDAELLYIGLDEFNKIEEQLGLEGSESVLKNIGALLKITMKEGETLARYSDHVFTVIIEDQSDEHVLERAAAYLKSVVNYSGAEGGKVTLSCSIGISRITEKASSVAMIIDNADRAYFQAKNKENGQVERYKPMALEKGTDDAAYWNTRLEFALKNDGFELFYQPIVSLHGEEQEMYDVLLRLKDDGSESILAGQFIKYANKLGWMESIDKWVIAKALKSLANHRIKHPKTRFFIRFSKQTFAKSETVDWLQLLLTENNLDGHAVVFEISEVAALENLKNSKVMISKLRDIGCGFALQHFGSGLEFSQSLNEFDVDFLKINGTFVENMTKDTENQAVVKGIIEMSKRAGKHSIAEFVSDASSLALLWRLGVDYAQGYYIHEPSNKLDYNFEDDDL